MVLASLGGDTIRVVPGSGDAWRALDQVMLVHGYYARPADTDSYNCRQITGGRGLSLHAFGIALDINWGSNPYRRTPSGRRIRYSSAPTQYLRALDVKRDLADTDTVPAMIRDVLAIRATASRTLFDWGGSWRTSKDPMHFQLNVTPAELAAGIDWETVVRHEERVFVRRGDQGPTVETYQRKLARLSAVHPGEPDGDYGSQTARSVEAFQRSRVPPVIEGTAGDFVGPWTKDELDRAEAEPQ
jgi:hypothetical protein